MSLSRSKFKSTSHQWKQTKLSSSQPWLRKKCVWRNPKQLWKRTAEKRNLVSMLSLSELRSDVRRLRKMSNLLSYSRSMLSSIKKRKNSTSRRSCLPTKIVRSQLSSARSRHVHPTSNCPNLTSVLWSCLTVWTLNLMKTESTSICTTLLRKLKSCLIRSLTTCQRFQWLTRRLRTKRPRKFCCITCLTSKRLLKKTLREATKS